MRNPRTEVKADNLDPDRGPMLVISGEYGHQVPHAIAHATCERQLKNPGTTEFAELAGRFVE
ncbi:hypothetical protein [Amycolatopsis sp. WQ 127309]|uniref:hypothetical protein n=1 Tax=Amycolatopsis sp. WQ 127309 TaxID=2932773 RepID=UPI001FF10E79|nr:hypothetical protein [Amycolatopsis sp. WQ 127309]UOZ07480.1 hypothetical protein MUY22_04070 [Amycolatopsis sp. WQ 127309]